MYKINYTLCTSDGLEDITPQVVRRYKFMIQNIGTNFATFMDEESYSTAGDLEAYSTMLKNYYISLFFDNKIILWSIYRFVFNPNQNILLLWKRTIINRFR